MNLVIRDFDDMQHVSSVTTVETFFYNFFSIFTDYKSVLPVPLAAWSKAWVCGHSLAGICGFETC